MARGEQGGKTGWNWEKQWAPNPIWLWGGQHFSPACAFPCQGFGQHPCGGEGGRGQPICRCRTNVPTITSVLVAWGGLRPHSSLWAGDPRLVVGVKALQRPLSRMLSHCVVCKVVPQVLCGCLELEAFEVLMQTQKHKAIRHDPPWQSPLQNVLVSWGESRAVEAGWVGVLRGWEACEGHSGAGPGVAAVQLYAFCKQTCAEQLGEHASQWWSAFVPLAHP